jgi:hypothetical protein
MHYGFGFLAGSAVGAAGTAWVEELTGNSVRSYVAPAAPSSSCLAFDQNAQGFSAILAGAFLRSCACVLVQRVVAASRIEGIGHNCLKTTAILYYQGKIACESMVRLLEN